jgi:tetratricopeptide (TPR) repeat protein
MTGRFTVDNTDGSFRRRRLGLCALSLVRGPSSLHTNHSGDGPKGDLMPGTGQGSVDESNRVLHFGSIAFVCTGEYWTIGYDRARFSLKTVKGLSYIQRLLEHPGQEFHSLDLLSEGVSGEAGTEIVAQLRDRPDVSVRELGDAGEVLDDHAKLRYRDRLRELAEELEDLRERGAHEKVDKVLSEIDFIQHEIARAVGLGGRSRRAGSAAERARLNVTRAIKSAIEKIHEHDSTIGKILSQSIRTGSFCAYVPEKLDPTARWNFSLAFNRDQPVESAVPIFRRSESAFALALAGRRAFVGREVEIDALESVLEKTRWGKGQVAMLSGPPGVGKTRIAAEFCVKAQRAGELAFVGGCSDRDDPVPFLPFVEIFEQALASASSPVAFRDALGSEAPEVARLMPQLKRIFPDIPATLEVSPEHSRRLLLTSITKIIERVALTSPLILVLEDLHWADEGTLSLLEHIARSISEMRVLIIGTYRETEMSRASALADTLGRLIRLHLLERTNLSGLSQSAVAEMLRSLSGQSPPSRLVDLIYANTEGNPFFIEELFQHLVERGKLLLNQGATLDIADVEVPQNVRLVISRRLSGLSKGARSMLETAAVIGRSFTFELLHASAGGDADELLGFVDESEGAGLITSTLQYPDARFRFAHELIRRTVIDAQSAPRCQRLHLKVADAIEQLHAGALDEHIADLAHHFWQAGKAADSERTIHYLQMAADAAIRGSATVEAIGHLKNALTLLSGFPETAQRLQKELLLQTTLGTALVATKGFSSLEVKSVYDRARELSKTAGQSPEFFRVVWGQWISYASRSEYETAHELGERCLQLAQDERDPALLIEAHHALGVSCICEGQFVEGLKHCDEAVAIYDPERHASHVYSYGQDPAAICHIHAGQALWTLGYPDRALTRIEQGLALGRDVKHPGTSATTAAFAALVQQFYRNSSAVGELAETAVKISTEYNFAFSRGMGSILGGWALTQIGRRKEGIVRMQEGLDDFRGTDAVILTPYFSALLVEAYSADGRDQEASDLLDEIDPSREPYWEAELCRLKGELNLRQLSSLKSKVDIQVEVEDLFRRALTVSRKQLAKSLELRAAMSLSRVWSQQGRSAEALDLMSGIFGWFTEGFQTPDLLEARALLEELYD